MCCALEEATSAVYLSRVLLRDSWGGANYTSTCPKIMGVETEITKEIQKFLQMLKFRREELDRHEFFSLSHADSINLKYFFCYLRWST